MINWKKGYQIGFDLTFDVPTPSGSKTTMTQEVVGLLERVNPKEGTVTVRYSHPLTFNECVIDLYANLSEFREQPLF